MLKIGLDTGIFISSIKKEGEKFHNDVLEILENVNFEQTVFISSALILIEIPGGLCSSTSLPIEKIYQIEKSLQMEFQVKIFPFDQYISKTKELMFEFRDLKRKLDIESADFHHLATSIQENCSIFLTIDERHLLNTTFRNQIKKYIEILSPTEFLQTP